MTFLTRRPSRNGANARTAESESAPTAAPQVSNIESVLRIIRILEPRKRLQLTGVFVLMVFSAVLEMLNIGLFLPLMHVLLDKNGAESAGAAIFERLELDRLVDGFTPFGVIAAILISVFIIKNILITTAIYLQARFVADLRAFFTVRLVEGYARRGYEEHLSVNSAHAVYDISQTAPSVVGGILQPGLGIVMEILLASGALAALVLVDAVSALIAGTFVLVALMLYYTAIRRGIYRLSGRSLLLSRLQSRFSHFFLGATKESLVLRRSRYFIERIRDVANGLARINTILSVVNQLPRIYGEIVVVGAIILVTAYIIDQKGSAEEALPLLAVFAAAAFRVLPSANRITHYFSSLRQTAPLLDAIYPDLVKAGQLQGDGRTIDEPRYDRRGDSVMRESVTLHNVSYRYPDAAEWTLSDIDIEVRKGEAVAFVGRTGAGKSTLVDIILGLLPPSHGEIRIDGAPVTPGPGMWGGRIGYVPQSIYLMDDTLRRNIAIGLPDERIDEDRLREVIRIAQLGDVLAALPAGLDSEIGERGIRLSGGQRQRIGIARALYSDPEILVLDEATSALDSSTERDIADAIDSLSGQKTIVVIAHRLATVRRCDNLYFLENGRVTASGRFEALAASCPAFRRMVELAGESPAAFLDEPARSLGNA